MSHDDRSGQAANSQGKKPVSPAGSSKAPEAAKPADKKFGAGPVKKEADNKKK